jgi:hypothetical protein
VESNGVVESPVAVPEMYGEGITSGAEKLLEAECGVN